MVIMMNWLAYHSKWMVKILQSHRRISYNIILSTSSKFPILSHPSLSRKLSSLSVWDMWLIEYWDTLSSSTTHLSPKMVSSAQSSLLLESTLLLFKQWSDILVLSDVSFLCSLHESLSHGESRSSGLLAFSVLSFWFRFSKFSLPWDVM